MSESDEPTGGTPASDETRVRAAFDAALPEFVNEHVRNSPVSRSADAWNHLTAALPKLADLIVKHLPR